MSDEVSRIPLEQAILRAANAIHEDETRKCFDSQSVEAFFKAWLELVAYYEKTGDTVIGVEVVSEYLDWIMRFSTVWHSERRSPDCREIAQEACEELESYMNEIIKAVDSRLYPTGR